MNEKLEIKNNQVSKIFKRWNGIWCDQRISIDTRLKAYSVLEIIEALVLIYEHNEILDAEEIDDLFISWNKEYRPLFPENYNQVFNSIIQKLSPEETKASIDFKIKSN